MSPDPMCPMASPGRLSPVSVAVLALLAEEPMHAYRMQQLIKERGVEFEVGHPLRRWSPMVVNVRNRSGLHAALDRLVRDQLVRLRAVERDTRHPERTVYELTAQGREALLTEVRDSVAMPAAEFPLFPAVVSFLHLLDPRDGLGTRGLRRHRRREDHLTGPCVTTKRPPRHKSAQ
jgi:DNA-binding PadR family transcriptional regulator